MHPDRGRPADRRLHAQDPAQAPDAPAHALDDREVAERYWPGRTGRAFP
ncbi:amidohydrolase, partial [Rathayibacter sp. AY1G1]